MIGNWMRRNCAVNRKGSTAVVQILMVMKRVSFALVVIVPVGISAVVPAF